MKPLLILDAFCGAGGAAAGYWQALGGNCGCSSTQETKGAAG